MIQLSTPIQTVIPINNAVNEMEGNQIEGLSDESSGHLGKIAEKKNGPGIFAKLLESLTAKNKAAESEDAETEGKTLPEAEITNTSNQLLPERMALSLEQTNGLSLEQTTDLSVEEPIWQLTGLSIEELGDLSIEQSIAYLIEPAVWPEAENLFVPEEPETINGELHLVEALLAQDRLVKEAGARQVEVEEAPKGNELVHPGENTFPREMAFGDEGPAEGELSVLPGLAEAAEEGRLFKAEANDAKRAQARSFAAALSENAESEVFQVKYQSFAKQSTAGLEAKSSGEKGEAERGKSRTTESRGKKGREVNVEFVDLRTEGATETANVKGVTLSSQGQTQLKPELEISVDLGVKTPASEAGKAGGETFQSRAFEDALAQQLRGGLSTDIVRDATVIARNGGEGSIRLTLHPASLGNVKIRLEMTENKITGLIVVESDEALKAFQRELPVLEKAFRDSGFSETNLQMSLAQDGRNYGGEERRERDFSAIAPVMAASRYEGDSEWIEPLLPVQGETVLSAMPERIPVNLLI